MAVEIVNGLDWITFGNDSSIQLAFVIFGDDTIVNPFGQSAAGTQNLNADGVIIDYQQLPGNVSAANIIINNQILSYVPSNTRQHFDLAPGITFRLTRSSGGQCLGIFYKGSKFPGEKTWYYIDNILKSFAMLQSSGLFGAWRVQGSLGGIPMPVILPHDPLPVTFGQPIGIVDASGNPASNGQNTTLVSTSIVPGAGTTDTQLTVATDNYYIETMTIENDTLKSVAAGIARLIVEIGFGIGSFAGNFNLINFYRISAVAADSAPAGMPLYMVSPRMLVTRGQQLWSRILNTNVAPAAVNVLINIYGNTVP